MKRIELIAYGEPESAVRCVEADEPGPPGPGEALVAIEAFPLNPADFLLMRGLYGVRPPLPAPMGAEAVGRVLAVGPEVEGLAPGQAVVPLTRANWAERILVPAAALVPVPDGVDRLQLAMLKVNPATAWQLVHGIVDFTGGDWLAMNAGASALAHLVLPLAREAGIRTLFTVRREDAAAELRALGADLALVDGADLGARVRAEIGDAPVRLGLDAVAGAATGQLADCLSDGATLIVYGNLSGAPCEIAAGNVLFRDIVLRGFRLPQALEAMSAVERAAFYGDLANRVAAGTLASPVEATYPIDAIADAVAHADRAGRAGKVLVTTAAFTDAL
ncbi:MAG: zinc-dependent alcohol dehydrogenase family protein [Alphaproteobacteria bacterium]